jgi:glycosyltransferase involved in cell wall biosynthesis
MISRTESNPPRQRPLLAVIIPSYNEGNRLTSTLEKLVAFIENSDHPKVKERDFAVVVVDDGSDATLAPKISREIRSERVQSFILKHWVNLGQGAAIQTGIEFARETLCPDHYITMDADGQHSPTDIPSLLETLMATESDVVFGNRFLGVSNAPPLRRAVLAAATRFEYWITGLRLGDAHNGYRIFNSRFAQAVNLKYNRMAHATEFKELVGKFGFRFAESKVNIHYSEESLAKGQSNIGAFRIIRDLIAGHIFD